MFYFILFSLESNFYFLETEKSSLWYLDTINSVEFYAIWHGEFCLKQINLPTLFYKSL